MIMLEATTTTTKNLGLSGQPLLVPRFRTLHVLQRETKINLEGLKDWLVYILTNTFSPGTVASLLGRIGQKMSHLVTDLRGSSDLHSGAQINLILPTQNGRDYTSDPQKCPNDKRHHLAFLHHQEKA